MFAYAAQPFESIDEASAELCTLVVTVDREDAWLFECARMVVERLGGRTMEDVVYALTAEGCTTLRPMMPAEVGGDWNEEGTDAAQRAWEAQLRAWREEAEERCEATIRDRVDAEGDDAAQELDWRRSIEEIDAQLRQLVAELTTREVAMGKLAETFWNADGWRKLGFATESQYARERLGMSLSCVEAKRRLARTLGRLQPLEEAIEERRIGYEAARLVAGVANRENVGAWIARAAGRTVKHLREGEGRMEAAQMSALSRLGDRLLSQAQMFSRDAARLRARGRVTLRLRVTTETRRFYRWLEQGFHRYSTVRVPFLRFLCRTLIETWRHTLGSDVAYAHIYARDRYRCKSPVCSRHDLTPHHLRFRSAGGDDSDENLGGFCVWCHLHGVHEGRLIAEPPASAIRWHIGRKAHTLVDGRRRIRLHDAYGPLRLY